ncbi:Na+/H+ antiporter subunit E [Micromonospora okii]|uniref:Na+/H+ antiporter subunit E n=1 Tax=Micromonospora okii TaxID=1182970 RepID=UPI0021071D26|nr:Na+/H+ antiporter subunit E [Micromonospora okii]
MTGEPPARTGPGGPAAGADAAPPPARARTRPWRDRLVALAWMALIWCLLWGRFTWGNLVAGLLVAAAVLVFFPLPPVTFGGRLRPRALLVLLGRFLTELVVASAHVAWLAVRFGHRPRDAIIAVRLRVRTDLNLALTAELISLVPGTLIIEVDRDRGVLYVHVLDARGPEDLAASRRRVLVTEARLVRAIGSPAELRLLDTPAPADPGRPGGFADAVRPVDRGPEK